MTGSNRNTAMPARQRLEFVGRAVATIPERFANATPTGTSPGMPAAPAAPLRGQFDDPDLPRPSAPGQRADARGPGVGRPVGAGIAGHHVEAALEFERRHRGAARLTRLAAGHGQHHGGPGRDPEPLHRHHHLVHRLEVARRTWFGHAQSPTCLIGEQVAVLGHPVRERSRRPAEDLLHVVGDQCGLVERLGEHGRCRRRRTRRRNPNR